MLELSPVGTLGQPITAEEVLATRSDSSNVHRLPALREMAAYSVATAERGPNGQIRIRLWMNHRDAEAYLEQEMSRAAIDGGAIFAILPARGTNRPSIS
ncbi:MAG: hypothetical protein ACYDDF_00335 [Thermoplasmatota archaeon]